MFGESIRESFQQRARLYALGSAELEIGDDHAIGFTSLFNQSATDYAAIDQGILDNISSDEGSLRFRLQFEQRTLWFNQLRGRHALGDADVRWHVETALARRVNAPGRKIRLAWRPMMKRQALDFAKSLRSGRPEDFRPYLMEA